MIDLSLYAGSRIAVFGLGLSGVAAAKALQAGGATVAAWDDDPSRRRQAQEDGVTLEDLYRIEWGPLQFLVLSPGVPLTNPAPHPLVARALKAHVEILGDIELFARTRPRARIVGITGTNGKSSTAALIHHMLREAGANVQLGGNIGVPVLQLEPMENDGIYVIEFSSFQLDLVRTLVSDIAVLLNISPDHIERHGNFSHYVASKTRIFSRQDSRQTAIVSVDDDVSRRIYSELADRHGRRVVPISVRQRLENGIWVSDGILHDGLRKAPQKIADLDKVQALPGVHNQQNAAAAYAVVRALGFAGPTTKGALESFKGLAHRLEIITQIGNVVFVNDSKATNAAAAARGLACYGDIYWIAGGRAKEGGIATLSQFFPRIIHAFLIGEAAGALSQTLDGRVPYTVCETLDVAIAEATDKAVADHKARPVVLLSPACSSYDQFENFEDRGTTFKRLVLEEKANRGPDGELRAGVERTHRARPENTRPTRRMTRRPRKRT